MSAPSLCGSLREAGYSRGVGERDLQQGAKQVSIGEEALSNCEEVPSFYRLSLSNLLLNLNVKLSSISFRALFN